MNVIEIATGEDYRKENYQNMKGIKFVTKLFLIILFPFFSFSYEFF